MGNIKKRSGLSTVVTTAILLTAITIMGSMIVGWANISTRTFETNLSNIYTANVNKINEAINIESVDFCQNCYLPAATPHGVNVTLTNTGTVVIGINQIKLGSNATHISNLALYPGKSSLNELKYNWQSGVPINIIVTTNRSSTFSTQVTPP